MAIEPDKILGDGVEMFTVQGVDGTLVTVISCLGSTSVAIYEDIESNPVVTYMRNNRAS